MCDNALVVHGVIAQLFAQNTVAKLGSGSVNGGVIGLFAGKKDALPAVTSEAEVLSAACSQSYAMQAMRPLAPEEARSAFDHVLQHGGAWLEVEKGVLNVGARYVRRRPGGSAKSVAAALKRDRIEWERFAAELAAGGERAATVAKTILSIESKALDGVTAAVTAVASSQSKETNAAVAAAVDPLAVTAGVRAARVQDVDVVSSGAIAQDITSAEHTSVALTTASVEPATPVRRTRAVQATPVKDRRTARQSEDEPIRNSPAPVLPRADSSSPTSSLKRAASQEPMKKNLRKRGKQSAK